jgi:uncharacterized FlaG/YvyC family protein
MAGEISQITGVLTESLGLQAGTGLSRAAPRRQDAAGAREPQPTKSEPVPGKPQDGSPAEETYLASRVERAQEAALAHTTTLTFERDEEDGRMYIHVKDKRTGEELYRIPRNYLQGIDPKLRHAHRVDVRI